MLKAQLEPEKKLDLLVDCRSDSVLRPLDLIELVSVAEFVERMPE